MSEEGAAGALIGGKGGGAREGWLRDDDGMEQVGCGSEKGRSRGYRETKAREDNSTPNTERAKLLPQQESQANISRILRGGGGLTRTTLLYCELHTKPWPVLAGQDSIRNGQAPAPGTSLSFLSRC